MAVFVSRNESSDRLLGLTLGAKEAHLTGSFLLGVFALWPVARKGVEIRILVDVDYSNLPPRTSPVARGSVGRSAQCACPMGERATLVRDRYRP